MLEDETNRLQTVPMIENQAVRQSTDIMVTVDSDLNAETFLLFMFCHLPGRYRRS